MIDIVIAIYRPGDYLIEQLESIVKQSEFSLVKQIIFTLDESSHETLDIVDRCRLIANNIVVVYNKGPKGPVSNFLNGIKETTSPYIMLSDQDDFWLSNKIEVSYYEIIELEKNNLAEIPLLVGTDLKVTDENLNILNDSFFNLNGFGSNDFKLINLCFKNVLPGCTMIFNRALKVKAIMSAENKNIVMHDWWLLLVCGFLGEYKILNVSTILYRQHDNNCIGAGLKRKSILEKIKGKVHYFKIVNAQFLYLYKHLLSHKLSDDKVILLSNIYNGILNNSLGHYVKHAKKYFN